MSEYKTIIYTDGDTGEAIGSTKAEIKPGTQIKVTVTQEEQRESYKNHQEAIEEMKETIAEDEGAFVHLIYKYGTAIFRELEEKVPGNKNNIHVIRFMMLATCLTFGGNLFDDNKHRVKKSSLKRIWDVQNRNSINETYEILKECGYIYETEEGYIMLNEEIIVKGAIDNFEELRKQGNSFTYTRIFIDNLRDMFKGTEPKQRKHLANLFKILPYVNFKYNVFCSNPTEVDKTKLELLDWTDLAKICGYNIDNASRLKKDLMKLKIYGYDVIGQFETGSGRTIKVNPKVYYSSDDVSDVKELYNCDMFDMIEGYAKNHKK